VISNECRILLIDDDEEDFMLIRDLLAEVSSSKYRLSWKSNYNEGLKALKTEAFEVCLLDYKLGEKTGLELLSEARAQNITCPFVFLTGLVDFSIDMQAMEVGASDFLAKEQLTSPLLERSLRYAIKHHRDMNELKDSKALILQQDRLASLGLLASSLAHEIGTPMGIIRSRAEMAEKKAGENEILKRDMGVIILQIDRITKLVNSLLHLAREKKSELGSAVDLSNVIQDVMNLLEHEFSRKSITLKKNISDKIFVKAEAGPLGQVLLNLLINSIHAIEESRNKGVEKDHEVTLSATEVNDRVQILVQDSGMGITEENQRHLFKPFFTTKDIGRGTGLGLATSYQIVASWGGGISVSSKSGVGSTFTIELPKFKKS
jgi:signal transduction histidine kinase